MNSNDNSRGGKKPAGSGHAGKRPHATLDLKAVEIKDPVRDTQRPSQSDTTQSGTSQSDPAPGTKDKKATQMSSTSDKTSSTPEATRAQAEASKTAADDKSPKASSNAKPEQQTPPPQIVRRRGGFFGPLIGGIVGGALALFGGDYALQQLGIPKLAGAQTQSMDAVESRLADLEQQISSAGAEGEGEAAGNTAALEAVAQQLEGLKSLPQTTTDLAQQQAELKGQLEALTAAQSNQPDTTAATDALTQRLSSLEERLTTLSAAAEANPNAGPLPQMAALTQKISELETAVANQAAQQPAALSEADNQRIKDAATTAATAKTNAERLDTTVASVKSNTTRLEQRVEALQTNSDKLSESIKILNETTLKMSSEISSLRATLQNELGAVARPADINAAVTPYKDRIAHLEENLKTLENIESERAAQARNVVLSLELADLQRAVNAGQPFSEQLNTVKASAGDKIDLGGLEPYASKGVATLATLQDQFRPLIHGMMQASKPSDDASLLGRLVDQAKSVVRVRRVAHEDNDTSVEAVISRMETSLKAGNLGAVLKHAEALPEANKAPADTWLAQVAARTKVDAAMANLQSSLKTSLSNTSLTGSR